MALYTLKAEFNQEMRERLKLGVLGLIASERKGEPTSPELISKLIHIMLALGFYRGDFEERFLADTQSFLIEDSREKVRAMPVTDYTAYVNGMLESERRRVEKSMDVSTLKPLTSIIEKQLIAEHINTLLQGNASLNHLLQDGNVK